MDTGPAAMATGKPANAALAKTTKRSHCRAIRNPSPIPARHLLKIRFIIMANSSSELTAGAAYGRMRPPAEWHCRMPAAPAA